MQRFVSEIATSESRYVLILEQITFALPQLWTYYAHTPSNHNPYTNLPQVYILITLAPPLLEQCWFC